MVHLQVYESFSSPTHRVAAYTNFPEYREFKLTTVHDNYLKGVEWLKESEFNRKTANGFPVYVVDNLWEFWENQDKPPVNWPESKPAVKVIKLNRSGHMPLGQNPMEISLGCSYKKLMDQAKSPEEIMAEEIKEDPTLIDFYSTRRPLVYAKASALLGDHLPSQKTIKSVGKWKQIRDFF